MAEIDISMIWPDLEQKEHCEHHRLLNLSEITTDVCSSYAGQDDPSCTIRDINVDGCQNKQAVRLGKFTSKDEDTKLTQNGVQNGVPNGVHKEITLDVWQTPVATETCDLPQKLPKRFASDKPPFFYCRWTAEHPYIIFGICMLLYLIMVLISATLYAMKFPILPIEFEGIPITIPNSKIFKKERSASGLRHASVTRFQPIIPLSKATNLEKFYALYDTSRRVHFGDFIFMDKSESGSGNILTKDNLQKLAKFEKMILNDSLHYSFWEGCTSYSLLRLFDGSLADTSPVFYDPLFNNITGVINEAFILNSTRPYVQPLLSKMSVISSDNVSSDMTLMVFYLSLFPNRGGGNNSHYWHPKFDGWINDGFEGLTVYIFSLNHYLELLVVNILGDIYLALGSCIFIFIFVWFETGSLWLSSWGLTSAILSFIVGNLIYATVFKYQYFGIFHVLSIFIILGIAADDIFIFCDTWKATGYKIYPSLAHRMSDCYIRAAVTMFVTSITTAAAFFASSFSEILVISSFGLFAGLVILVNYLSAVIFYPSVIVIYHLKFENLCCKSNDIKDAKRNHQTDLTKDRIVVKFLSTHYFRLIKQRVFQIITLLTTIGFISICCYFIIQIRTETQEPKFLRPSNAVEQQIRMRFNDFRAVHPTPNSNLHIFWGLKSHINTTRSCKLKQYDRDCYWEWDTLFDEKFDLNPPQAQLDMLDFCRYLKTLDDATLDELRVHKHPVTGERRIYCFVDSLQHSLRATLNMSLPSTQAKVQSIYPAWRPYLYTDNFTDFGQHPNRYMEDMYRLWVLNAGIDKIDYGLQVGVHNSPNDTVPREGAQFAFVSIKVVLDIEKQVMSYSEGMEVYDKWEKLTNEKISSMSPSMNHGFQTTNTIWSWFELMSTLSHQGMMSICVGVFVAWVILILSCGNWVIGTMATVCIACICISVIGMIGLAGWKYGVIESLNTTLVVGLAIDYVVHFGVAYTSSPYPDRSRRVQYALTEIGLPVISGAATTLGSSFFMLFSKLQFLFQFSIFMFCTIGFSILYCMTFFLVVLMLVGPQGETGSNRRICLSIRKWCAKCRC